MDDVKQFKSFCQNSQLKAVVSEVFDDLSCGCTICSCGSKNDTSDSLPIRSTKRPKRLTFPEILFDYLKENNSVKYGVKWVQFGILQPIATILDCVEVDWDILLSAHKSVKTKQNLVKSFTNWKFVKIKEKPELWFCDQLDINNRSLFRPDNPQLTKLIKVINDNNQLNPSFGFQNKKILQSINKSQLSIKDSCRPLIDNKLGENTIESIIWYKTLEINLYENYNEVQLSSFIKCANLILNQRGIQFTESDLYLFIGRESILNDEKISTVTLDSLVKFVRNFGPWESMIHKMQQFLQDGAREWYHGSLSDQEVSYILTNNKVGSYLIRNYPTDDAHFALNYNSQNGSVRTLFITRTQNNYHFNLEQNQFLDQPSISYLLNLYKDVLKFPIKKDSFIISLLNSFQTPINIPILSPSSPNSLSLNNNESFSSPESPFLSNFSPVFQNIPLISSLNPSSPNLELNLPNSPKLEISTKISEVLVLRIRLVKDEFFKEIRVNYSNKLDYFQFLQAVLRKIHVNEENIKCITKDQNVIVDEDNVEYLLPNQELVVHLIK